MKFCALVCQSCANCFIGVTFYNTKCKLGGEMTYSNLVPALLPTSCEEYTGKIPQFIAIEDLIEIEQIEAKVENVVAEGVLV